MSEMNDPSLHNVGETPEPLPDSQNIASYVEKKGRSPSARAAIYFSFLTIIGSLIAGWGAHQEEQSNEILAGVGQMIYLALAIVLNFALLLIHIIDAKRKGEAVSKLAAVLLMVPIVIFIGFVNVANAITDFQDSRPPAPVERKPLSKAEQDEIQSAVQKYRQKKIDTLQKYGFYYLTDNASYINRLELEQAMVDLTLQTDRQEFVQLKTKFTSIYMINSAPVDRITQIVMKKSGIANLPCYGAQSFLKTITSCVSIAGTFAGDPIHKAVQAGDMRREGTYYYATDGKLLIEIKASDDDQAIALVSQLKLIDDRSAGNLLQKLTADPGLLSNKTSDYR